MQPERVCAIIMACGVLHNIAIERHEPQPPPGLEGEQDEEYDAMIYICFICNDVYACSNDYVWVTPKHLL